MDFRILGPIEVVDRERRLDLGPLKQRSLLAILLLRANRVVSTDRLLDELWGDDAVGKERALWVYISRLRTALEPEREERGQSNVLLTRDHGYVLTVAPDSVDASRFEQAAQQGRSMLDDEPAAAAEVLRGALAMWRGGALEDFTYEPFAAAEIARLEELRLDTLEARIDADLRLHRDGELVGELEALVAGHPLRERPVRQLMLALYRCGRQADALRAFQRYRRRMGEEFGLEPSPELCRLEEQIVLHDTRLQPVPLATRERPPVRPSATNPFKGLRAFTESDAEDFFGRDRLVRDVIGRLDRGDRLVALIGPSGSGKSSAVYAGLLPALRKADRPDDHRWVIATMAPGEHPFVELEAALLHATLDGPPSLAEQLGDEATGLLRAALRVLPDGSTRLLLLIDQFEELFTSTDATTRDRFLTNLVQAIEDVHDRVAVVLTLRADFYDRPLVHPAFGTLLGAGVVNVVPLSPDELEAAAQTPALHRGVAIEPALLTELLVDVVGQPGALPTFQYTLTELYERRDGDRLTVEEYRAMGGVRGALTRRADDLYDHLTAEQQDAAKQLFVRLVTISEQQDWTRRRVPAEEVVALDVDVVAMEAVIDQFGRHRFLSFDRDQATGSPTVEVAHETLLHAWPRLRSWIEEGRDDVRRRAALGAAIQEWERSGRAPDYLLTGGRLADYERWRSTTGMKLTATEAAFLDAAHDLDDAARAVETKRQADEARLRRRARRRLLGLVAVVVSVAVAGVGIFVATRPEEPKTVALLYGGGGQGTTDDLIARGLEGARRDLGFKVIDLGGSSPDISDSIGDAARAGADLFIVADSIFNEIAAAAAPRHPGTTWVYLDSASPGAASFTFADEQAAFLVGAAAAATSKTGKVGFVGGFQSNVVERFRAGYEAGARAVNPQVAVLAAYNALGFEGFGDAASAETLATGMYDQGADVVFAAAGPAGLGAVEAARSWSTAHGRQVWAIGADADQYVLVEPALRPYVLTSTIKRYDAAVRAIVEDYLDGGVEPVNRVVGLTEEALGFATSGAHLATDVVARIEQLQQDVVEGRRIVPVSPSGPLGAPPSVTTTTDARVTFDGTSCRYDGPTSPAPAVFRFTFVNLTADDAYLVVGAEAAAPILGLPAEAHGENVGFARIDSAYHLNCFAGPDVLADEVPGVELKAKAA